MKNRGVIDSGPKSTDFVAGTIPYAVRNLLGDWRPYSVRGEIQWTKNHDNMDCVTESLLTDCEVQIKAQTGVEVNFADRELAKLSGTTTQGNRLDTVVDTLRHLGVVAEEVWSRPLGDYTWEEYYSDIPQFIIDRGRDFLNKYDVQYEWVGNTPDALRYHLKHTPLQGVIPGHAVCILAIEGTKFIYQDSYDPFIKSRPITDLTNVLKVVLTVKGIKEPMKLVNDNGTIYIQGEKGKIGLADEGLYQALKEITTEEIGSTAGIPQTKVIESVDAFQIKKN